MMENLIYCFQGERKLCEVILRSKNYLPPFVLREISSIKEEIKLNIKGFFKKNFERVIFVSPDKNLIPLFKVKLLLLSARSKKRKILDEKGEYSVNMLNTLGELFHYIFEIILSFFFIPFIFLIIETLKFSRRKRKRKPEKSTGEIFYIFPNYTKSILAGGSVNHMAGVISGLEKLNYKVTLFSMRTYSLVRAKTVLLQPLKFVRNFYDLGHLLFNFKLLIPLFRESSRKSPDFIYQRHTIFTFAGLFFSILKRVPFVLEYNGSEVWVREKWGGKLTLLNKLAIFIERRVVELADFVVVVSKPLLEEIEEIRKSEKNIIFYPNCVREDMFEGIEPADKKQLGFSGDEILVTFVGTFGPWHGAEILAKSVKMVISINPKIKFLFVGDGQRKKDAEEILRKDNMLSHCTFTGIVSPEEVASYLLASDILVSPHVGNPDGTPFFGSPTKLFEYMLSGKPIIASRIGQIAEILEDGKNSLLVEPGNSKELAEKIIYLASHPDAGKRLGENAKKEALEKYVWKRHAEEILKGMGLI